MKAFNKKIKAVPNFNFIKTKIASPSQIQDWSERFFYEDNWIIGKVNTFSAKSYAENFMQITGLYCPQIFGPVRNRICACAKYCQRNDVPKSILYCENCKVEITHSSTRITNLGYLVLANPVANPFFLNITYNFIQLLISIKYPNITPDDINEALYYDSLIKKLIKFFEEHKDLTLSDIVITPDHIFTKNIRKAQNDFKEKYKDKDIENKLGIEFLNSILETIDLNKEIRARRSTISSFLRKKIPLLQLRVLESFAATNSRPSWLILKVLPVIGPKFRSYSAEERKGELAPGLGELYITISDINLQCYIENIITKTLTFDKIYCSRELQIAVDNLFTYSTINNFVEDNKSDINDDSFKGLTDQLEGKHGHFRHYMLGKRVDYSARSVIISGPNLKINQCGLPYLIASELFQENLRKKLYLKNIGFTGYNENEQKKIDIIIGLFLAKKKLIIWPFLQKFLKKEIILLNRAPTLHKGSLQCFNPILTLNLALHLHPMACSAFNADFDGDQLSINISKSKAGKVESLAMLKPIYNIISVANLNQNIKPTQETVAGIFYSTISFYNFIKNPLNLFSNFSDVFSAFFCNKIAFNSVIYVNIPKNKFFLLDINVKRKNLNIRYVYALKEKLFLLTNFGFIICTKKNNNKYMLNTLFIETTVGQLIYNSLFQKNFI